MGTSRYVPEKDLNNTPDSVPINVLKIIIEQSEKSICKIKCKEGGYGTGFFCIIPFPDKFHQLPVLMTNNHVIDKEGIIKGNKIQFTINNDKINVEIIIDDIRRIYTNKKYDITIIEINKNDKLDMNSFLEIDYQIFKDNLNDIYKNKSIYLIGHPKGESTYSMGLIKYINEKNYDIRHTCKSYPGSSGCPIINLSNNKVIGIHKGAGKNGQNWNLGTLLKEPIEIFKIEQLNNKNNNQNNLKKNNYIEELNNKKDDEKDEITIIYEFNKKENKISEEFIKRVKDEWGETVSENKIFGETFVKNNKNNCKIIINEKEIELCSYLNNDDLIKEKLEIKLKGIR